MSNLSTEISNDKKIVGCFHAYKNKKKKKQQKIETSATLATVFSYRLINNPEKIEKLNILVWEAQPVLSQNCRRCRNE